MPSRDLQSAWYSDSPVNVFDETVIQNKGDIVMAAVDSDYVRIDLSSPDNPIDTLVTPEERLEAYPSQWAALLVTKTPYGIKLEQFGTGTDSEARTDRQLMNQVLQVNAARAGGEVFRLFGGHIVERARVAGRGILGILEVNNVEKNNAVSKYVSLSYPRGIIYGAKSRVVPEETRYKGVTTADEATQMVFSAFSHFAISLGDIRRGV